MPSSESCGREGTSARGQGADGAEGLIGRVRRLAETPRPAGGYPLEWLVEASHLGDLTAIASLALRSERS